MEFFPVLFAFIAGLFSQLGKLLIGNVPVTSIFVTLTIIAMVVCFFWRGAKA